MEKKIYLFELDSVRKTDDEVRKGLFTLYEEIVYNGNVVVVSFNQLVDSRLFLSMLKKDDYFKIILDLFKKGRLIISRFDEFRTASQYVQRSIKKNLKMNANTFIFSALPVKSNQKYLLKLMERALLHADLSEFTEYIDEKKKMQDAISLFDEIDENGFSQKSSIDSKLALDYLRYIKRFIELVLEISINEKSYNMAKDYDACSSERFTLVKFIDIIIKFSYKEEIGQIWENAVSCLEKVKNNLEVSEMNDRSNWIKKLISEYNSEYKQEYEFAEMLVNLCYNYAVEASIANVSRHYNLDTLTTDAQDLFWSDFLERVKLEWENGKNAENKYLQDESNNFIEYKGEYPNWESGLRILNRRMFNLKPGEQAVEIPLYESNHEKQRKIWNRFNIINIMRVIGSTLLYILLLITVNMILSIFQNEVGVIANSILTIVIFMILSELIGKLFKLSSLSECINSLVECVVDFYVIVSKKEFIAYKHSFDSSDVSSEKPSVIKDKYLYMSYSLQEYITLWKEKPELFFKSDLISIVDPRTAKGIKKIIEFEVKNDVKIGVVYMSSYSILVVDLIENSDGTLYAYERLIPTVSNGAVLIVVKYLEKLVLLSQFRHALRDEQLAFPRGYGEIHKDGSFLPSFENVKKEIYEELGAEIEGEPIFLGEVVADSGISGNIVSVYAVTIKTFRERVGYEGIKKVIFKTEEELENCIKNGEITDGFTLSGYLMYKTAPQK
ncbi:MAG: NUDIX hydrolase [Filifactoraceae bacterium]